MTSFEAIEHRHAQVVIYQDEAKRLSSLPQFGFVDERNKEQRRMWLDILEQGMADGSFRPDLDVDLVYRFIRDTTWVSVRWYQPGGPLTAEQVGRQYLAVVLGGITPWSKETNNGSEAYIVDAVRTRRSEEERLAGRGAPDRPRRARVPRHLRPRRRGPGCGGRRHRRLRRCHRRAGRQHRPADLAGRRIPRSSPRRHRRPAVAVPASRPSPSAPRPS